MSADRWDAIGQNATCSLLQGGAELAGQAAIVSAFTGQIWGVVGGAAGLLAAEAMLEFNGCNGPLNPDRPDGVGAWGGGCTEVNDGGCMSIEYKRPGEEYVQYVPNVRKWLGTSPDGEYPNGTPRAINRWIDCDGNSQQDDEAGGRTYRSVLDSGSTCKSSDDPPRQPGDPIGAPVTQPDPLGGDCEYTTTAIDSYINSSGGMSIKYKTCASGPGCSGCSYFWYHGPGNVQPAPPEPIPGPDGNPAPAPPPDGSPNNPILDDIKDCACNEPPEPPEPEDPDFPVDLQAWEQPFKAVCDVDDEGKPLEVTVKSGSASKASEALVALANNQRLLVQVLQQHLNWKTPICDPDDCELEGEMRTISFRSSETSPFGKSRLRKRLRYRSSSGIGRDALVDHWRLFVWNAGPVRVIHTGSCCGTPSVWAANELEGKRVLRHAFAEAGINPDQVGRWKTCSSDNARLGVPGEMSVDTTGGYYWITERDGSDARPMVAKT